MRRKLGGLSESTKSSMGRLLRGADTLDGDKVVVTMKKGEVALLTIPPEPTFGSIEPKQDLAVVPPNSTVVYEIELVSFVKEKESWVMSTSEKIEAAGKEKEDDNALFKLGRYARASKRSEKRRLGSVAVADASDDDVKMGADPGLLSSVTTRATTTTQTTGLEDQLRWCDGGGYGHHQSRLSFQEVLHPGPSDGFLFKRAEAGVAGGTNDTDRSWSLWCSSESDMELATVQEDKSPPPSSEGKQRSSGLCALACESCLL